MAKERKVSPELSGTTKASTTINEPLDAPMGDELQIYQLVSILTGAAASPQSLPLVAWWGVKVNEAAVALTKNYFISGWE